MNLKPHALQPLPLGQLKPQSWLRRQLQLQADGLTGHLDEFWADIKDSSWIGGDAEGWERVPYWLDGLIPLAFSLEDEALLNKVHTWINEILQRQREDGWLGPAMEDDETEERRYDPWPRYIVLKFLLQYYQATQDPRVLHAMKAFLRWLDAHLQEHTLTSWAYVRWGDLAYAIHWLYEQEHEDWLLTLAERVHELGFNWRGLYEDYPHTTRSTDWDLYTHVVNNAMAVKTSGEWFRQSQDPADRDAAYLSIERLDHYHGQATGVFTGDENVAGKHPSQGTELCAVVEYMFSLERLIAIMGDSVLADRLERMAYNALPATFTPDMWAHQYDQQANQVVCKVAEDRIYTTNAPDSNIYGLEPNFGCCLANMHQGWPKFAAHLWMRTADNGLAAIAYGPCSLQDTINDVPVRVEVSTDYPFEDTITLRVQTDAPVDFPLQLRIPAWCTDASLNIDGETQEKPAPGGFHTVSRKWEGAVTLTLTLPSTFATQTRYNNSIALLRGPLVYSLKMGEEFKKIRGEEPHADYEVYPTTPWNYALAIDRNNPEAGITLTRHGVGHMPFSPDQAPHSVTVTGRRVPGWELEHNAAAAPPESPVQSDEPAEELTLIPYGSTNLRVTEFPTLQ